MLFEEYDEKKYMNLFIEEGIEKGRDERNKEVAADLLREGNMPASVIARISKLSEDNVRQLAISLGVSVL